MTERKIVTAEEVARTLRCGRSTVYYLAKIGRIPCLALGEKGIRFDLEKVVAALERQATGHEKAAPSLAD